MTFTIPMWAVWTAEGLLAVAALAAIAGICMLAWMGWQFLSFGGSIGR